MPPAPKKRQTRPTPPLSPIRTFGDVLDRAGTRPAQSATSGKGPYGTKLSNSIAVLVAELLRPDFVGILPTQDGEGTESRVRSSRGFKKLDVNYSTLQTGLGLGVSIKTINYRDPKTKRYTKNYSRNDNELRAEASDYHGRQPYAVMAGLLFLPWDAAEDSTISDDGTPTANGVSSYGACVKYFRNRAGRHEPDDLPELFEKFYVCLYRHEGEQRGVVRCVDVMSPPPRARPPRDDETLTLEAALAEIRAAYDARNGAGEFTWAPD